MIESVPGISLEVFGCRFAAPLNSFELFVKGRRAKTLQRPYKTRQGELKACVELSGRRRAVTFNGREWRFI